MAWPTDDLVTANTDQGTDNPSLARAMINTLLLRVKEIIGSRGVVNGVCDLDATSKVPIGRLPIGTAASNVAVGNHGHLTAEITGLDTALAAKAPLASPSFTGVSYTPTVATGTNNAAIATTNFVRNAIAAYAPTTDIAAGTAALPAAGIGTYAFLRPPSAVGIGNVIAGSSLYYTDSANGATATRPTGTWKSQGVTGGAYGVIFVRIA